MKQLFLASLAMITFTAVNAQDISENTIGLRLGDSDGFGAEVTYQRALSDDNRIELDLGLRSGSGYNGFKLAGLYQWVWLLDGNFNWYAGAGGGIGAYKFDEIRRGFSDRETFAFAAGDIGIEYNFDFPLQVSLDVRPELSFDDFRDGLGFDVGLSARYRF